ncbi:DNA-binding response regulator [Maribacter sp.]|uniref:DNA-binding response regulator n=1 Tax=Maribacter sp. TaxID=1897614 RepID=UPI0025B9A9C0|nr:DNA-binding response regulator [Maribacter sp.]
MFKKVLIAEDFQDTNQGIVNALKNKLHIPEIQEELYCDKAHTRLKVAEANNTLFDLLITDLSFKGSHVKRTLTSGEELIAVARNLHPNIKVIVNSMEDNPARINALFKEQKINGYVCKGRHGLIELVNAVQDVYANKVYMSPQINISDRNTVFELDEFDVLILKELENGLSKKEISNKLKLQNISPNSESSIDKKISKLFDEFGAKNSTSLISKLIRKGKI